LSGGHPQLSVRTVALKSDAIALLRQHHHIRIEMDEVRLSGSDLYSRLERLHMLNVTLHHWDQETNRLFTVLASIARRPLALLGVLTSAILLLLRVTDHL
jgi:hypothetical protein